MFYTIIDKTWTTSESRNKSLQCLCQDVIAESIIKEKTSIRTLETALQFRNDMLALNLPWKLCAPIFFENLSGVSVDTSRVTLLTNCHRGHRVEETDRTLLENCFCWKCGADTFEQISFVRKILNKFF